MTAMTSKLRRLALTLALGIGISQTGLNAAGLIVLEGSDSQTYHAGGAWVLGYSTAFLSGLQTYSYNPALPILVVSGGGVIAGSTPHAFAASVPALGALLGSYSGVYLGSPGTCCDEYGLSAAEAATLVAFVAAGGSLAIEDYQGNDPDYATILGFDPSGSNVVGYNTSGGGASCFDGNSVTPTGNSFMGFPVGPIPPLGCFGHQAYSVSYFAAQGFGPSLVDTSTFGPDYSVVLSNGGGGLVPEIPEPSSLILFGSGALLLIGAAARKRRTASRVSQKVS